VIYGEELLQCLTELQPVPWSGEVYRHMFGANPPDKENTIGARWNPPEVPAIYASLETETAKSEADYYIEMQPLRPKAERRIYRIRISLGSVLDLRDWAVLQHLGIRKQSYALPEPPRCKEVGGGIAHVGHDGLLVPSARASGTNVVIFPDNKSASYEFNLVDFKIVN